MKHTHINKIVLALIIMLSSCKKDDEMLTKIEKFEWLASAGASETSPMEIVRGSFIASDSSTQWIPNGEYLQAGWGNGNGVWAVGEDMRKVPERMQLTWFSYTENKFYTGNFELPQQKMYNLFKGNYGKGKRPNGEEYDLKFNELTVGLAPQGMATLWMSGLAQVEIGTFQAHETNIHWENFHKGDRNERVRSEQKDMLPFVQEEIAHLKISNMYWKSLLEKHHYAITFNKGEKYKLYNYEIWFINHEFINKNSHGFEFIDKNEIEKAIPSGIVLYIKDKFERKLEVRIDVGVLDGKQPYEDLTSLEERTKNQNLIKLFKSFCDQNKDIQLYVKFDKEIVKSNINKPVYSGKVFLKSATAEVEIPNTKVEVFDAE
jgi:hypothetical protein